MNNKGYENHNRGKECADEIIELFCRIAKEKRRTQKPLEQLQQNCVTRKIYKSEKAWYITNRQRML